MRIPPRPIMLPPSRGKFAAAILICLGFVALGVWLLRLDSNEAKLKLVAWLNVGFFGLGALSMAVQFFPGASFLRLDDEGFTIRNLYRETRHAWSDVRDFRVLKIRRSGIPIRTMVGFDYAPEYRMSGLARKTAKLVAGAEGALPDTYGMRAEELAAWMTELRSKSTRAGES